MKQFKVLTVLFLLLTLKPFNITAAEEMSDQQRNQKRMELFQKMEAATQVPWYYFAAIDQYDRAFRFSRKEVENPTSIISIYYTQEEWAGQLNPSTDDTNEKTIQFFNGIGKDGDGDGLADRRNDEDVLMAMAHHILSYGIDEDNFRIAMWEHYHRDKTVGIVLGKAKIYKTYGHINLDEKAFPLPLRFNYSYKNTWGDARGWGGRRIHEGTDIFANYGVPVRSTCYGIVEMKGWNRYGGWRVGIRDINNTYHYYAHLSGFSEGLAVGQVVKPGELIGGVGSTGYGPPGTSGKFPPHLHYGMYKDNGATEWSFDPYPHLRAWERQERNKK
ncbi:peptidase M23 [Bacillus coahuilensis m2-6]|uniref:Peptidase M23 n=1 Tax=Bacillus coahuilensis p1.1.43 TaxID=1150625 RepID=A0A147K699_9BACI|nr:peptidase M23 [Bacillus coahuilensis p1.1.43]KUP05942.1 peptidase M23 [Bacillus coahuilensis m2-6]